MPLKSSNPKQNDKNQFIQQENVVEQSVEEGPVANQEHELTAAIEKILRKQAKPGYFMQPNLTPILLFPRLAEKRRVTVAFPPCAEELLALIRISNNPVKDDINLFFDEYFIFGDKHIIIEGNLADELDADLLQCAQPSDVILMSNDIQGNTQFIGDCCLCSPCVTLNGNRNHPQKPPPDVYPNGIKRLFIGDPVSLFYFERMGIFQILGVILDSYA